MAGEAGLLVAADDMAACFVPVRAVAAVHADAEPLVPAGAAAGAAVRRVDFSRVGRGVPGGRGQRGRVSDGE